PHNHLLPSPPPPSMSAPPLPPPPTMSGMSGVGDNRKKNGDDKSLRDYKPSQASRNGDRAEKSLRDYKPFEKSLRDYKPSEKSLRDYKPSFMHDRSHDRYADDRRGYQRSERDDRSYENEQKSERGDFYRPVRRRCSRSRSPSRDYGRHQGYDRNSSYMKNAGSARTVYRKSLLTDADKIADSDPAVTQRLKNMKDRVRVMQHYRAKASLSLEEAGKINSGLDRTPEDLMRFPIEAKTLAEFWKNEGFEKVPPRHMWPIPKDHVGPTVTNGSSANVAQINQPNVGDTDPMGVRLVEQVQDVVMHESHVQTAIVDNARTSKVVCPIVEQAVVAQDIVEGKKDDNNAAVNETTVNESAVDQEMVDHSVQALEGDISMIGVSANDHFDEMNVDESTMVVDTADDSIQTLEGATLMSGTSADSPIKVDEFDEAAHAKYKKGISDTAEYDQKRYKRLRAQTGDDVSKYMDEFERAVEGKNERHIELKTRGRKPIFDHDIFSLYSREWLNDTIIFAYISLIVELREDLAMIDPVTLQGHMFRLLDRGSDKYTYEDFNGPNEELEFKTDTIFIPLHMNGNHWALCIAKWKGQEGELKWYNSMGSDIASVNEMNKIRKCLELAGQNLGSFLQDVKWNCKNENFSIHKQTNSSDCGLYVLANVVNTVWPAAWDGSLDGYRGHVAKMMLKASKELPGIEELAYLPNKSLSHGVSVKLGAFQAKVTPKEATVPNVEAPLAEEEELFCSESSHSDEDDEKNDARMITSPRASEGIESDIPWSTSNPESAQGEDSDGSSDGDGRKKTEEPVVWLGRGQDPREKCVPCLRYGRRCDMAKGMPCTTCKKLTMSCMAQTDSDITAPQGRLGKGQDPREKCKPCLRNRRRCDMAKGMPCTTCKKSKWTCVAQTNIDITAPRVRLGKGQDPREKCKPCLRRRKRCDMAKGMPCTSCKEFKLRCTTIETSIDEALKEAEDLQSPEKPKCGPCVRHKTKKCDVESKHPCSACKKSGRACRKPTDADVLARLERSRKEAELLRAVGGRKKERTGEASTGALRAGAMKMGLDSRKAKGMTKLDLLKWLSEHGWSFQKDDVELGVVDDNMSEEPEEWNETEWPIDVLNSETYRRGADVFDKSRSYCVKWLEEDRETRGERMILFISTVRWSPSTVARRNADARENAMETLRVLTREFLKHTDMQEKVSF
ncbi:MAG: hypothetical protein Q9180_004358, partial [Flavoplaca navasiana]